MKGLIFVASLMFVVGFIIYDEINNPAESNGMPDRDTWVIRIDGCEYISTRATGQYRTLCHKGNCDNPEHLPTK